MFRDILKDYAFKSLYYKCFEPIELLHDSSLFKNKRVFRLKKEMILIDVGLQMEIPKDKSPIRKRLSECEVNWDILEEQHPYLKESDEEFSIYYVISKELTHPAPVKFE